MAALARELLSLSSEWEYSVQFSCSVVSDSLPPHGLQHSRLPCPSQISRAYPNSCPLSQWCHPTISSSIDCREPARDIPLVTKVMRKEARHMQRRDRASGVPPDILEHLPPKNQSLPTLLLCALTSDFTGSCPPPPSRSLCQRVNLQLQLIKFLGN